MLAYAPVALVGVLVLVQAVFVLRKTGNLHSGRARSGYWYQTPLWDDIVRGLAAAAVLFPLCALGYSNVAWMILLPMLFFGGTTSVYHLYKNLR